MSQQIRDKFNIPDNYTRDGKLTNWMRKNMCMPTLEGVYIEDIEDRGTLTKQGVNLYNNLCILTFNTHIITLGYDQVLSFSRGNTNENKNN